MVFCVVFLYGTERTSAVSRADFDRMARTYCASTRPVLIHAAIGWFAFMGRPRLEARPEGRFAGELAAFETFMREERGLSPGTILTRHEQLRPSRYA